MTVKPCVIHEDDCAVERWDDGARSRVQWRTLLSADRTPTSAITLGVAELEAGGADAPRLHRHAQAEVYYILSGDGVVRIDGRDRAVRAGTALFIPGGAEHGAWNTGSAPLRILYAFPVASFDEVKYEFTGA